MTMYVDKETGLAIRVLNMGTTSKGDGTKRSESTISDIFFEFNEVTDEDFIEPDRSDFKEIEIELN